MRVVLFKTITTNHFFNQVIGYFLKKYKIFCKAYLTNHAKRAILNVKHALQKGGVVLKSRIGELRKRNKISQEELAMAVGVTRQTITSLECEKYTASLVLTYKIARYFDATIEEIFDFSEVEEI